jgi:hypothetical protein
VDSIFVIKGDTGITKVTEALYEAEDHLQRALADFPEVIAGERTEGATEPRLLLIQREAAIPEAVGGGNRFSLDNLYVDAEATPIFVEVKRSTDTRIRREVVGQLLDYAANGVKGWAPGHLRSMFEARVGGTAVADSTLAEVLGEIDPDQFWTRAEEKLRSGHIRMLFVADRLPADLVRIIEFLNEQMSPAEVLGIAVPQYVAGDLQVLVPSVVGRTSAAAAAKAPSARRSWDRESYLEWAAQFRGKQAADVLARMIDHALTHGRVSWGTSPNSPGATGWYTMRGRDTPTFTINAGSATTKGTFYVNFREMLSRHPDGTADRIISFLRQSGPYGSQTRLAEDKNWAAYPSISLERLAGDEAFVQELLALLEELSRRSEGQPQD